MTDAERSELDKLLDDDVQQEMPAPVEATLEGLLDRGEQRLVSLRSDITPNGDFGDRWFVITDRRVAALAPENGHARVEVDVPLSEVRQARVRDFVGSGSLEVETEDKAVEVVRFSRSVAPEIHRVQRVLRQLAQVDESHEPGRHKGGGAKATRCPTCGRVLPRWSEVCPFCMKRGQLLARLISYVAPYKSYAIAGFVMSIVLTVLDLLPAAYVTRYFFDTVLIKGYRPGLAIVIYL